MSTLARFGTAAPGTDRPPPPALDDPDTPRRRRRWPWVLTLIAVLLVAAVLTTRWTLDRHEVTAWQVTQPVAAGQTLSRTDVAPLRTDPGDTAPVDVVTGPRPPGGTARVDLPAGTLLTADLLTTQAAGPPAGLLLVGLQLSPAQNPAGHLTTGDRVRVLHTPPPDDNGNTQPATTLARSLRVWSARTSGDGTTVATLVVPTDLAEQITAYAANAEITVSRVPIDNPNS